MLHYKIYKLKKYLKITPRYSTTQGPIMLILILYFYCAAFALCTSCTPIHQSQLYAKKPAFYSYIIGDIHTDHIDHEYAADVYATPASCQKTVTALVALKTLGPDYQYTTTVSVTKKRKKIKDIIISFTGDPTLTSAHIHTLLKPLQNTYVKGKIILDASYFKVPPHSTNLMLNDIGKQYAQPIYSINIDKNLINITVTPRAIGNPALIKSDISYPISSSIITTADPSAFSCSCNNDTILATGTINPRNTTVATSLSPTSIDPYILSKITPILKALNIQGLVKIVHNQNELPTTTTIINTNTSAPLKDIIAPALKKSDNFVFDTLYLTIMDQYSRSLSLEPIKNWSDGDIIMKQLIKKHFALDLSNALLVDGSGLSRYNRIQPKQLFALLKQGFSIPEFMHALACPGEQKTTLVTRTQLPCTIKAKTGTLTGVSCLCGYNIKPDTQKAFVIMASNFAPPVTEITQIIDTFISNHIH